MLKLERMADIKDKIYFASNAAYYQIYVACSI